jgi:uncharacterized protein (TIGR02145 family)
LRKTLHIKETGTFVNHNELAIWLLTLHLAMQPRPAPKSRKQTLSVEVFGDEMRKMAVQAVLWCLTALTLVLIAGCSGDDKGTGPKPGGTVTDIDGNVYQTIKIGDQVWMAENLKVTRYRNGDPIPHVTDNSTWGSDSVGAWCNYNNDTNNVSTYGRLYNWYAVADTRNIAPEGWRVPTDEDWKQLETYLGMSQAQTDASSWRGTDEGGRLKDTTTLWSSPNAGATNETGFTALPGGYRFRGGGFYGISYGAGFWSATEESSGNAWTRYLGNDFSQVSRNSLDKYYGYSVRCVRD